MEKLFQLGYFAGMLAEIIIRAPYDRRRRAAQATPPTLSTSEQGILDSLLVTLLILPILKACTPWLDWANYRLPKPAQAAAGGTGALCIGAAAWVLWHSHRDLGHNWSPTLELRQEQTLITQGIYRYVRHPMYASQLLWSIGQLLLLQNWLVGPAAFASFFAMVGLRVPQEEAMMRECFGEQYERYSERTGRFIPHDLPALITRREYHRNA